jgi:hypothetical protein
LAPLTTEVKSIQVTQFSCQVWQISIGVAKFKEYTDNKANAVKTICNRTAWNPKLSVTEQHGTQNYL